MSQRLNRGSNYPGGFRHGLTVQNLPIAMTPAGKVFWVDENGGGGSKGSFDHPIASIDAALSQCVADRGDVIMVKPGHVENISAAGDLTCDVGGVSIVGTGTGTKQAQIVFDTAATADIDITADNVTFDNMWFLSNFATGITAAIDVAAVDYCTIQGCKITDTVATSEFLKFITLAENAPYFAFNGNVVNCFTAGTMDSLVFSESTLIGFQAIGNTIVCPGVAAIFDLDDDAIAPGPIFRDNLMVNLDTTTGLCVAVTSATVAVFCNEKYASNKGNTVPASDLTASFCIECYGAELHAVSSLLWPATATAWS